MPRLHRSNTEPALTEQKYIQNRSNCEERARLGTHSRRRPLIRPHGEIISRLVGPHHRTRATGRLSFLPSPRAIRPPPCAKSVAAFSLLERRNRRLGERERGTWRRKKLRRSSSAASRRRRSPSGSSSIPPAAKSNTSPKVPAIRSFVHPLSPFASSSVLSFFLLWRSFRLFRDRAVDRGFESVSQM